jgi:hypothetical protein
MPGPNLSNLLTEYVDTIPVLPETVTSGNSAYHYFLLKHQFTDISLFNNQRFEHKIRQVAKNPVQADALWTLANRVNLRAQAAFDQANPK